MIALKDIDPSSPFLEQLQEDEAGPIVLVNTFVFPEGSSGQILDAWTKDAAFMLAQPGCLSTQLHEGVGSNTLVNIAVWETSAALRAAFAQPRFQAGLADYPDGLVAFPHVVRKIAVEGICGD